MELLQELNGVTLKLGPAALTYYLNLHTSLNRCHVRYIMKIEQATYREKYSLIVSPAQNRLRDLQANNSHSKAGWLDGLGQQPRTQTTWAQFPPLCEPPCTLSLSHMLTERHMWACSSLQGTVRIVRPYTTGWQEACKYKWHSRADSL